MVRGWSASTRRAESASGEPSRGGITVCIVRF
jgi:hypothetical protein